MITVTFLYAGETSRDSWYGTLVFTPGLSLSDSRKIIGPKNSESYADQTDASSLTPQYKAETIGAPGKQFQTFTLQRLAETVSCARLGRIFYTETVFIPNSAKIPSLRLMALYWDIWRMEISHTIVLLFLMVSHTLLQKNVSLVILNTV